MHTRSAHTHAYAYAPHSRLHPCLFTCLYTCLRTSSTCLCTCLHTCLYLIGVCHRALTVVREAEVFGLFALGRTCCVFVFVCERSLCGAWGLECALGGTHVQVRTRANKWSALSWRCFFSRVASFRTLCKSLGLSIVLVQMLVPVRSTPSRLRTATEPKTRHVCAVGIKGLTLSSESVQQGQVGA